MSSLADRLAEASRDRVALADPGPAATGAAAPGATAAEDHRHVTARVREDLLRRLADRLDDPSLGAAAAERLVHAAVEEALRADDLLLTTSERTRIAREISDDLLGHGPLEPYLVDPDLTEIVVNGCDRIYVRSDGRLVQAAGRFTDEAHLRRTIDKLVSRVGARVDQASPIVDARLPDGTRVNAVIPPLALDGSLLTIRKFAAAPYTVADLVAFGTCSQQAADLIAACVRGRLSIVVSGDAGSGTTTTLSVLASFIPADQRIVTVEEAAELRLPQDNVARLAARPPDAAGQGAVRVRDLVANALRMRPDRLVVGDLRDSAALELLQAISRGHDGVLCAVHSTGPPDTLARLAAMAGDATPGHQPPGALLASAVDLVVHQSRLRDGSRRITHVTEVHRSAGEPVALRDLLVLDDSTPDGSGRVRGQLRATGLRPGFAERLARAGEHLDPALFATGEG